MQRTVWILPLTVGLALWLSGCGASGPKAQVPQHRQASTTGTHSGQQALVPAARWTCSSPAPPAPGAAATIAGSGQTLDGRLWQAAALRQKGCLVVYRSADGGRHWSRTVVVPSSGDGVTSLDLLFVDPRHGWILAPGFPAASQAPWQLYHTTDGGAHWTHQPLSARTPFPSADEAIEMAFSSPRDGWLTGLNGFYAPPRVFLYRTVDGGNRWTVVSFPVPPKLAAGLQYANPPVFTDSLHGTMTVTGGVGQGRTILTYTTQDGGSTWTLLGGQSR